MFRHVLIALVAAWLLGGCAGAGQKAEGETARPSAPSWLMNPEKSGFISVVASAPKQDWGGHAAQFRVAEMKARQELAHMVRVRVESTNRYATQEHAGEIARNSEVETRLQSSVDLSLESARVIEEWTDPHSGELYIWLVTPVR